MPLVLVGMWLLNVPNDTVFHPIVETFHLQTASVALKERRRSGEPLMSAQNAVPIHLVDLEIFHWQWGQSHSSGNRECQRLVAPKT